jgi:hypothetical protein
MRNVGIAGRLTVLTAERYSMAVDAQQVRFQSLPHEHLPPCGLDGRAQGDFKEDGRTHRGINP